ncbi:MAG: entericidin A/B family lipoprotein [Thermodesulfovibrionales bacterium]|jgi:predicted small secreted protein
MIGKVVAALLLIIYLGALSGCNTVKGLGEDIQSGGRAIGRSSGK